MNKNINKVHQVMRQEAKATIENLRFDLTQIEESICPENEKTDLINSRLQIKKIKERTDHLRKVLDTITAAAQFDTQEA